MAIRADPAGAPEGSPVVPARITPIARLHTLARPRPVNAALSAWDELDAMSLMPPTLRPHVAVPELGRPYARRVTSRG